LGKKVLNLCQIPTYKEAKEVYPMDTRYRFTLFQILRFLGALLIFYIIFSLLGGGVEPNVSASAKQKESVSVPPSVPDWRKWHCAARVDRDLFLNLRLGCFEEGDWFLRHPGRQGWFVWDEEPFLIQFGQDRLAPDPSEGVYNAVRTNQGEWRVSGRGSNRVDINCNFYEGFCAVTLFDSDNATVKERIVFTIPEEYRLPRPKIIPGPDEAPESSEQNAPEAGDRRI
jgi:hypothetical protein